jgi:hypothetical protein
MQRIDIMLSIKSDDQRILIPIELKACEANADSIRQMQRYIDWIEQYYIPNRQSDILPMIISKRINNKYSAVYQSLLNCFKSFNQSNFRICHPLKFIEYHLENSNLLFEQINY